MAVVHIHPALTRFTDHQNTCEINIENTSELLEKLCNHYPTLATRILTTAGQLTPYINLYLNGKNINQYKIPQAIHANDKIDVVTALVGG